MKWEVTGADRESGSDRAIIVEGVDEAQATRRANREGIVVATVRQLDPNDSVVAIAVAVTRPAIRPPALPGAHPADAWHYRHENRQFGPVGFERLKELVASGQILVASDIVWQTGMAAWVAASSVPALVSASPTPVSTVRAYRGEASYRYGLDQMLRGGWQVQNTVSSQPRSGCLRILFLGFIGAAIFRPKNEFVVTFVKPRT